jgi:cytochrome P450
MTHTTPEEGNSIDWWPTLMDQAFLKKPYPTLKRMQQQGLLHHDPDSNIFFVLGYAAFSRILKAPEMGRDTRDWQGGWHTREYKKKDPVGYALFSGTQHQMINCDGDDHTRLRGVYTAAFRAQMMHDLAPMIEAETSQLLDRLPTGETVNFIKAFAGPLPLRVLCNLFDIPSSMDADISRWSAALIRMSDIMMTPEQKQEALDALIEFKAYLREQISARRDNPGNNLMDVAIQALNDGILNEEETLTDLLSMLIAGHETTVTLIGNGLYLLLENPDQMAALRQDRALMRTAIEEFLRVEPGGNMILRVAKTDYQIEGQTIPAGSLVLGLVGGVNRDPARFENPDQFDVSRTPNPHLTFGGGAHICIGAPLARLEAHISFSALLDNFSTIELVGKPEWRLDRLNARGLGNLPIRLERAC